METQLKAEHDVQQLYERYKKVRAQSFHLCKPLKTEDYVAQPVVDVSPPKWHLGHTTWFFETLVLKSFNPGYKKFHKDFSFVFNSYYESVGERVIRANRGDLTRPTVDEVLAYRNYVDEAMDDFFASYQGDNPRMEYVLEVGLNHEQQHQELLVTDLKYILGVNPLFPVYRELKTAPTHDITAAQFLSVDGGIYEIGYGGDGFYYDNEKGVHQVYLHPFSIADKLVTNGEFLEFIEAGGYRSFEYWLAEGWDWVKNNQINSPEYWHRLDDGWYQFTLGGLQKVNEHEPVTHVSFYEADAFANWKGLRLPTEFEWETACNQYNPQIVSSANFVNDEFYRPVSPTQGNLQFYGDVWEWTASAYRPYPFFEKEDGALGEYNGKFMVNQMVLRGGSCATPRDHIRPTYRNFFHPHLRWQFNGIRLAKND